LDCFDNLDGDVERDWNDILQRNETGTN
jgi:hypothetical protein